MQLLTELARDLRDKAARGLILRTDRLSVGVHRDGLRACLYKWTFILWEAPELWDEEVPEANSDGVPTSDQHRAILLALADHGPLHVEPLQQRLRLGANERLYDKGKSVKELAAMGLVELTSSGYRLTKKGRGVVEELREEEE